MAVFTELDREQVATILKGYDIGSPLALVPIESGIENTNYYLDTEAGRWVLTVFERLRADQVPFYLRLTEHLARHGCPTARLAPRPDGAPYVMVRGKPCAIAARLEGRDVRRMGPAECRSMGQTLARMHLAARDFPLRQENLRGLPWWEETAPRVEPFLERPAAGLLASELDHLRSVLTSEPYLSLPSYACHCDLFRNNALIAGSGAEARVSGVFDFYFAGCVPWLYDLAVTVNDWCVDDVSGRLIEPLSRELLDAYHAVRPLSATERELWRDALRAAAMRFWLSRLFDFYLPRQASLLKPHDPTHFERVLRDRRQCPLYWPDQGK